MSGTLEGKTNGAALLNPTLTTLPGHRSGSGEGRRLRSAPFLLGRGTLCLICGCPMCAPSPLRPVPENCAWGALSNCVRKSPVRRRGFFFARSVTRPSGRSGVWLRRGKLLRKSASCRCPPFLSSALQGSHSFSPVIMLGTCTDIRQVSALPNIQPRRKFVGASFCHCGVLGPWRGQAFTSKREMASL